MQRAVRAVDLWIGVAPHVFKVGNLFLEQRATLGVFYAKRRKLYSAVAGGNPHDQSASRQPVYAGCRFGRVQRVP
ncbi:hypothetical protein D3C86_1648940 [compost metagenome]